MQMEKPEGRVSYEPNSLSEKAPRETPDHGFHSTDITETGNKGRIRLESFADHYSQARQFYISQTAYEQAHIASALVNDAFIAAAKTRHWDREKSVRILA